jgi:PAS domain-containing protein
VLLFEGGILADATPAARQFLALSRLDDPSLRNVAALLARSFPDLPDRLVGLRRGQGQSADFVLKGTDPDNRIRVEAGHGLVRLLIDGPPAGTSSAGANLLASLEAELLTLRSIAEDAPQLIWKEDSDGRLLWANSAYLRLADRASPTGEGDPLWPAEPVFANLAPPAPDSATATQRAPVPLPGLTEPLWFDVTSIRRGAEVIHFAADASNLIQAESGRQKFIQTLTKTFAHLAIGLAIFDRDRRLTLFNPAFLDLTGLPVTFLSARPLVHSVLDRLHDMNMLPEPKNYASWRDQVVALEAAAVRGTYCETWSLPSGRTYRVTGRPHPDGAIAFLFEDISDEVLLTRHFRSELETAQAAIDSFDEAIAVFSQSGTLVMTNARYAAISGLGTDTLADIGLVDEMRRWRARSAPTPVWERILRGTDSPAERSRWQDSFRLDDGRMMICRFAPLPGGKTLIGLRFPATDPVWGELAAEPVRSAPRHRAIAGA